MAKNRIQKHLDGGKRPKPIIATLCEEVTLSDDARFSLMRLFDEVYTESPPAEKPLRMKGVFFVQLLANGFVGVANVRVVVRDPAGDAVEVAKDVITFSKTLPRATVQLPWELVFGEPGIQWFGLYLDDELSIEIPLKVIYEPAE